MSSPWAAKAEIHPLVVRLEPFGLTYQLMMSNLVERAQWRGLWKLSTNQLGIKGGIRSEDGREGLNVCSIISRTIVQIVERNRRATSTLSPILYLFQLPSSTLSRKLQQVLSEVVVEPIPEQRRPGPREIPYGIPEHEWQVVLARVANHESYRTIAKDYRVSRETIRRLVQAAKQAS